jgi:hypothetical protein
MQSMFFFISSCLLVFYTLYHSFSTFLFFVNKLPTLCRRGVKHQFLIVSVLFSFLRHKDLSWIKQRGLNKTNADFAKQNGNTMYCVQTLNTPTTTNSCIENQVTHVCSIRFAYDLIRSIIGIGNNHNDIDSLYSYVNTLTTPY